MIKIFFVKAEAKRVLTQCKKWIRSVVIVINMMVKCCEVEGIVSY